MPARLRRKELREAFGQVVRELRIEAGLTQERLAFLARVHRTYVGDLERGEKSPTLDTVDALATALSKEPGELVEAAARRVGRRPTRKRSTERARQRVRNTPEPRKHA